MSIEVSRAAHESSSVSQPELWALVSGTALDNPGHEGELVAYVSKMTGLSHANAKRHLDCGLLSYLYLARLEPRIVPAPIVQALIDCVTVAGSDALRALIAERLKQERLSDDEILSRYAEALRYFEAEFGEAAPSDIWIPAQRIVDGLSACKYGSHTNERAEG